MAARRSRRLLAALLLAALALALPRCAAAPAAKSSSRAHRKAHKESVRAKKHAADRRDRLSAGATVGTGDAALLDATAGMCNFMETEAFEEFFSGEANDTRWDLGSMDGLFHCSRGNFWNCAGFCARFGRARRSRRALSRRSGSRRLPLARRCAGRARAARPAPYHVSD